jgi:hypothetical protein
MMIRTVQQTVKTAIAPLRLSVSAGPRIPLVNPGVIVVLLFVRMADVLLDEGVQGTSDITGLFFFACCLTRVARKSCPFCFFPAR